MRKIAFLSLWTIGTSLSTWITTYIYLSFRELDVWYVSVVALSVGLSQASILSLKVAKFTPWFLSTTLGIVICASVSLLASFFLFAISFFPPFILVGCGLGGALLGIMHMSALATSHRSAKSILVADIAAVSVSLPPLILVVWMANDVHTTSSNTFGWMLYASICSSAAMAFIQGLGLIRILNWRR